MEFIFLAVLAVSGGLLWGLYPKNGDKKTLNRFHQGIFIVALYVMAIVSAMNSFGGHNKTVEQALITSALLISAAILHAKEREINNRNE
jgi:cytochrome b subunit of formate dehydrogenase